MLPSARSYGVLIKELRLLARSIFILDKDDVLRYREIVPEQSNHPDYDKALEALRKHHGRGKGGVVRAYNDEGKAEHRIEPCLSVVSKLRKKKGRSPFGSLPF